MHHFMFWLLSIALQSTLGCIYLLEVWFSLDIYKPRNGIAGSYDYSIFSSPFLLSVVILVTVCSPSTSPEQKMLWDLSRGPLLGPLSQMLSQETSCNILEYDTVKPAFTLCGLQKPQLPLGPIG